MRNKLFFWALCFVVCKAANAQTVYWQQQVNYNINVTLNDKDHTLDAFEKLTYTNNSPDTLKYIWFHIWMNAYKNDKTAFSEQLLVNGRTDFYFSDEKDRGYTSKLDFKVDDIAAKIEPHPEHIDIVKLLLPKALPPHLTITIETPFRTQLPYNFSRGGHILHDYQLTQWYPKPAVYDKYGWHEMPYLDQGEFYSEFGSFEVNITLPENYLVAATGELQTEDELKKLKALGKTKCDKQPNYLIEDEEEQVNTFMAARPRKKTTEVKEIKKIYKTKTLVFKQDNVHDFAWFASPNFLIQYDTMRLANKTVDCFSFYSKKRERKSASNIYAIKSILKKYSNLVGVYPYNTATVVVGKQNNNDGMEYPTITYINIKDSSYEMQSTISHELGHNWFYGILGSNERTHPWMDEGMNTYYDERKWNENKITDPKVLASMKHKPRKEFNGMNMAFNTMINIHKNYPIDTAAIAYDKEMYGLFVYEKAAYWMKELEAMLGRNVFDSIMKTYYEQWKFKHPYPQDFKAVVEQV
ncbi:MAG: M1 family metallopeptidase, partial [Bacteroidetes bacterium]|nr:M1 family metallopeptidase [Bacteroidota bacterium]